MKRLAIWSVLMFLMTRLLGCGPGLFGSGPHAYHKSEALVGPRYHVAKDVVVVEATVTNSVSRSIADDLSIKTSVSNQDTVEWSVSLKTVADPSSFYVLDVRPSGSKDQSLGLQVAESGLLTSINYTSTDKTGEIITNVAKSVASVAGAFFGFRDASTGVADPVFDSTDLKSDPNAAEAKRLFATLPKEALFFIKSTAQGKVLITEQIRAQLSAIEAREQLAKALRAVSDASDENAAKEPRRKADSWREVLKFAEERLAARTTAFASAMDSYLAGAGLGKNSKSVKESWTFELNQLPTPQMLEAKSNPSDVIGVLSNHPRAKALFQSAGIVVAYERGPSVSPPPTDATSSGGDDAAKKDSLAIKSELPAGATRIFFREATTGRIAIFSTASLPDTTKKTFGPVVRLAEDRMLPVIDPDIAPASVAFDAKAFSSQSLQLAFSPQGRLTGVTQGSSASVAAAVSSISSALASARDEFAASLTKAKDIQATARQIDADRLKGQLDELTARKQIVDAKVALSASTENSEAKLEKLKIDQQIELITQQLALSKLQNQTGQAANTADIDRIKVEIELLKQRIELMRQQAELDRLRAPSSVPPASANP